VDLQDRNVTLRPDPYWPDRFEDERERILNASDGGLLGTFHVGSTAVPDVPGKPALDVIAVYEDEASLEATVGTLIEDHGFERPAESTVVVRWEDGHAVFVKLHTRDDRKVRAQLAFREYLRENAGAREEYARVKRAAAREHPEDLEAYTEAKSDVVEAILDRAREEGYYDGLPAFA